MAKFCLGGLHVITDTMVQQKYSHAHLAKMALAGGAKIIQYRQKDASTHVMVEEARAIMELCREHEAMLIINDRLDIALAVGAHGVHLGQEDLPFAIARKYLGKDKILGCSAGTVALARQALEQGADYVGFGPVYATASKADASEVKGLKQLSEISKNVDLPIIAIGGINHNNAREVMAGGAAGVAVIGAICLADDPMAASADFVKLLKNR